MICVMANRVQSEAAQRGRRIPIWGAKRDAVSHERPMRTLYPGISEKSGIWRPADGPCGHRIPFAHVFLGCGVPYERHADTVSHLRASFRDMTSKRRIARLYGRGCEPSNRTEAIHSSVRNGDINRVSGNKVTQAKHRATPQIIPSAIQKRGRAGFKPNSAPTRQNFVPEAF